MLALIALAALGIVNRRIERALETPTATESELQWVRLEERAALPFWGSDHVDAVAILPGAIYVAGGSGVAKLQPAFDSKSSGLQRIDISASLPTRRATALCAWRTALAAGLENGGLFMYTDGAWSEMRSGLGLLHVRDLVESEAGELWIGAREGLFRIGFAERTITRVHNAPVNAIALGLRGLVFSGGEKGLFATFGPNTAEWKLADGTSPWVDDVAVVGNQPFVATPAGLLVRNDKADGLRIGPSGAGPSSIVAVGNELLALIEPAGPAVHRLDHGSEWFAENLPARARRLLPGTGGRPMVDTDAGLYERVDHAWRLVSPRRAPAFGTTTSHVGALTSFRGSLIVGYFDGGLAALDEASSAGSISASDDSVAALGPLPDPARAIWAVNALLDAGGTLHVASLRGAFRYDGERSTPIQGSGAAFSLASTSTGIAIGFGEGVLLPEGKLFSAFHGLPGNQATALAGIDQGLVVGTPSGLGYIEGGKVRWRVASGEGRLPHPWITAILQDGDSILVGTYGGGLVRRLGPIEGKGDWKPFVETDRLKINTNSLVRAGGRVYAGSDGDGLFRLSVDGTRFERLKLALPSMRITALFEKDGFLYIGTDEGLTRWPVERDERR